jgi:hypothetical protein
MEDNFILKRNVFNNSILVFTDTEIDSLILKKNISFIDEDIQAELYLIIIGLLPQIDEKIDTFIFDSYDNMPENIADFFYPMTYYNIY